MFSCVWALWKPKQQCCGHLLYFPEKIRKNGWTQGSFRPDFGCSGDFCSSSAKQFQAWSKLIRAFCNSNFTTIFDWVLFWCHSAMLWLKEYIGYSKHILAELISESSGAMKRDERRPLLLRRHQLKKSELSTRSSSRHYRNIIERMKEVCTFYREKLHFPLKSYYKGQFMVDSKHKLAYCRHGKVTIIPIL